MKVKIFKIIFENNSFDKVEEDINTWITSMPPGTDIQRIVMSDHYTMFLYGGRSHLEKATPKAGSALLCSQCGKNAPTPGKKSCEECQAYQAEYREQKKVEKRTGRYP